MHFRIAHSVRFLILAGSCWIVAQSLHAAPASLTLVKTIPLPGVQGVFDHMALDAKGQRLFLAALGNDSLEVLDVAQGKTLTSISGLHQPTGVLYLPAANQIVVANRSDGTCKVFDGTTYKLIKSLGGFDTADNLRFATAENRLFVGYGAGALAGLDVGNGKHSFDLKLRGHPESFQLEREGARIFVNVPEGGHVAVVNRKNRLVEVLWPLKNAKANFPMALDEANHRLFVGCREPPQMVVFDTATGRPVMHLVISGEADDLYYDATHKSLYISCGEGFIDVIEQRSPDVYLRRNRIPTRSGARTSYYSAELSQLFVAVPALDNLPAEARVFAVR